MHFIQLNQKLFPQPKLFCKYILVKWSGVGLMDWSYLSGWDYKRTRFRLTSGGEEGGRIIAHVTGVKQICLPNVICSFGAFTIWS